MALFARWRLRAAVGVLAVGVLVTLGALDNNIDVTMRRTFGISTGLLLSGTVVAVTYGYLVRFLALSFGSVEASLTKITHAPLQET